MKVFFIRLLSLSFLWAYCVYTESNQHSISILFFAIALGLYFILSLKQYLLFIYIALSLITFAHGYLFTDIPNTSIILLLFLMMDSTFRLKEKEQLIYMGLNLALIFSFMFKTQEFFIEIIFVTAMLVSLLSILNQITLDRKEQKELYDQLLGEYRKLKRMNRMIEDNARLEERTKIARDIHDSVGHQLTALIMKLEMLNIQNKSKDYEELKSMAKSSLEETRYAVKTLQKEESEGISTVVHLIRKLEAESHIQVHFTMKQGVLSIPLSNEKNVVLFRVIQESLTNAMRHANSREAMVILGKSAIGDLSFEIKNALFEIKPFTFGFGLKNMKERVESVEGTLQVYQTEDEFIVSGTIPREED